MSRLLTSPKKNINIWQEVDETTTSSTILYSSWLNMPPSSTTLTELKRTEEKAACKYCYITAPDGKREDPEWKPFYVWDWYLPPRLI